MLRLLFILLITAKFNAIENSSSGENKPLSDVLRWKYTSFNANCSGPTGGRNPCQDVRICNFAIASLLLGGRPTLCGRVANVVPKVCCGWPLVLGGALMNKVDEEISRKRECGRKEWSSESETRKKFFATLNSLPPIDTSHPEKFRPPLDLSTKLMVSPVGGTPSRQGDFPWMVAIFRRSRFLCGGSLIDRLHILSAAHCFVSGREQPDPGLYSVHVGNINIDGGFPFPVASIKIHEGFIPSQHYNDIAILTLPVEILKPQIAHICLPNVEVANMDLTGRNTTLLGWGDTSFGGRNAQSLHIVDDLPVVSKSECQAAYPPNSARPNGITDDFICAGIPEGGKDACQQDSGGPLMYKQNIKHINIYEDVTWALVGIVSFGYGCGEPGFPGVYTKVSAFKDWIAANTKGP